MVNINIEKKDLWVVLAMFIFVAGAGVVIAYNSGFAPNVMGHDASEIEIEIEGTKYALNEYLTNLVVGGDNGSGGALVSSGDLSVDVHGGGTGPLHLHCEHFTSPGREAYCPKGFVTTACYGGNHHASHNYLIAPDGRQYCQDQQNNDWTGVRCCQVRGDGKVSGSGAASVSASSDSGSSGVSGDILQGEVPVYLCPIGTAGWGPGGAWGYYECQGQLTTKATCTNIEYPHRQTRNCEYKGTL